MVVMNGYDEVERVDWDEKRYAELNGNRDPIPVEVAKFLKIKHPEDPWPEINADEYVFLIDDDVDAIAVFKKPNVKFKKNICTIASSEEVEKFCDRHFRLHPKTYNTRALDLFCVYYADHYASKPQFEVTWPDLISTGLTDFHFAISVLSEQEAYLYQLPMHELVEQLNAGQEYPDCIDFSDLLHLELLPFVCHTTHHRMTKQDVFRAAATAGYVLRPPYIEHKEYILREVHFLTTKTLEVYKTCLWMEARPLLEAAYGNPDKWNKLAFHNNGLHFQ